VGPAVGVAIGAGAGSILLAMRDRRPLLFAIGALAAVGVGALLFARRRRSCPTSADAKATRSRWIDVGIVAFAVTYAVGRFVLPRIIERL
jgi:hypothetical protein